MTRHRSWTNACLAIALALGSADRTFADPGPVSQLNWIFDGAVQAAARLGNTLYVGGTFSAVAPSANVLPPVYALSETTGTVAAPTFAVVVDGGVSAVEPDGAGGYFLGGNFVLTAGGPRLYLARVMAGGSVDTTFAPVLDGPVASLARIGATLYVAGNFTTMSGVPTRRLGAMAAATGARIAWQPPLPASTNPVQVLAGGDRVVVIGADVLPMVRSAAVFAYHAVTGAQLWSAYLSGGVQSPSAPGPALIAGAQVVAAHGRGLASLSLATGAVDTAWNPQVSPTAMALSGSTLYLGGGFSTVTGQPRLRLAAIDVNTAALLPWNPGATEAVSSLAVSSTGSVFASGEFLTVGGVARHHLAEIDSAGTVTPWIADARPEAAMLTSSGVGMLIVSGSLTARGNVARTGLAAFDLTTGALLPWAPVTVEPVRFLAATAGRVYVGLSGSLAVMDPVTGTQLTWYPATVGLFAHDPWIYWATSSPGGLPTVQRAALATGVVDTMWRPASFVPEAVTQDGTTLYFASTTAGLAAIDTRTARTLWTNAGATSHQVAVSGDTLFIASNLFTIMIVDARTGASIGSWSGASARALTVADGRVVAGTFGGFSGNPALRAYAFDGQPAAWTPAIASGNVSALVTAGDLLVVGGDLSTRTPQALRGLAVYLLTGAQAPTAMRARYRGPTTAFTWDAPALPPAGYAVEASLASGQPLGAVPVGNVTTLSVDVPPGSFLVRARTTGAATGGEEVTNEVPVRGGCTAAPPMPTDFVASVTGATLALSWTAPDALVTAYRLSAGSAAGLSDVVTVPLPGTQTSIAGAVPAGTYFMRLTAANACGTSAPTSELFVTIGASEALPAAPSGLRFARTNLLLPVLQWTPPAGTVTGYVLEVGSDVGLANLATVTLGEFPRYSLPVFTPVPAGTYLVRVRAVNDAGIGPPSADVVLSFPLP